MTALVVFVFLWLCIVGLLVCFGIWLHDHLAWVDEWASEHAHRDAMAALAPKAKPEQQGSRRG